MASTTFNSKAPPAISAEWLNEVNQVVHSILGGPSTADEVRTALSVGAIDQAETVTDTWNFTATPTINGSPILDASDKTGADSGVVSGTAGTSGNLAEWDSNGDLVDAGTATSTVTNHIGDTSNPHNVTKSQVGLGSVPNEDATDPSNWDYGLSGTDTTVITGTAGADNMLAAWDANGDLTEALLPEPTVNAGFAQGGLQWIIDGDRGQNNYPWFLWGQPQSDGDRATLRVDRHATGYDNSADPAVVRNALWVNAKMGKNNASKEWAFLSLLESHSVESNAANVAIYGRGKKMDVDEDGNPLSVSTAPITWAGVFETDDYLGVGSSVGIEVNMGCSDGQATNGKRVLGDFIAKTHDGAQNRGTIDIGINIRTEKDVIGNEDPAELLTALLINEAGTGPIQNGISVEISQTDGEIFRGVSTDSSLAKGGLFLLGRTDEVDNLSASVGQIHFVAPNRSSVETFYAGLNVFSQNTSAGSEDGRLDIEVMKNGSRTTMMRAVPENLANNPVLVYLNGTLRQIRQSPDTDSEGRNYVVTGGTQAP